jgi:hypothetical protein
MSKIKEIIQNSDLNDLNVGDKFDISTSDTLSIYDSSTFYKKNKISIYEGYKTATCKVTYISNDYLIYGHGFILLSFYRALPF